MGELLPVRLGHEAAQGDEGIAAPVGEPGVARDDRPAAAALHDIGVGRLLQGRGEVLAAPRLEVDQAGGVDLGVGLAGREHQGRLAAVQRPGENAGRRQVLDEVEAALALTIVLEIAEPDRLLAVAAVGRDRRDRRDAGIGPPEHARAGDFGCEREARVLVVQGVIVAAREQRPHAEPGRLVGRVGGRGPNPVRTDQRPRQHPPAHDHVAAAMAGDHLLADLDPVLGPEDPQRPGLSTELHDPRLAVRIDHVRGVALGAEGEAAARGLQPDLEPVDQHDPARGRRGRRQQQRVVAARAGAAHGAGGKAAKAIGLEPFGLEQGSGQGFGHRLGPPAPSGPCAGDRFLGSGRPGQRPLRNRITLVGEEQACEMPRGFGFDERWLCPSSTVGAGAGRRRRAAVGGGRWRRALRADRPRCIGAVAGACSRGPCRPRPRSRSHRLESPGGRRDERDPPTLGVSARLAYRSKRKD